MIKLSLTTFIRASSCLAALGLALGPAGGQAADVAEGIEVQSFEMVVAGTSSLHDWESEATQLTVDGSLALEDGVLKAGQDAFTVRIPVSGIVSPHKRMDRLTYDALKSKEHPSITYQLRELEPLGDGKLRAIGELTIAGSAQPLAMEVQSDALPGGAVQVTGSAPLAMTDFGIKPPSLMLGAIKVGDAINVTFTLTININTNLQ